jgi:hypothetical protein
VLVEALIAKAAVQAFHEGVLGGFARSDVVPLDPSVVLPSQNRMRGQLGPLNDHQYPSPSSDERSQLAHYAMARQRGVGDQRQALALAGSEPGKADDEQDVPVHLVESATDAATVSSRPRILFEGCPLCGSSASAGAAGQ